MHAAKNHLNGIVPPASAGRYHRQMLLPGIGLQGQQRLSQSRILLVGCGALGTVIAEQLARAGVGFLRIADRDIVELTNLQRQVLFDEEDVRQSLPKAIAAANRLRRINAEIIVEPLVIDVHSGNIEDLLAGPIQLILDGTDNLETRYLINDVAIKHRIPWIYGGVIGTEGRVMPVFPGKSACLRCVFPDAPAPGELPTCDTAGVLGPAVAMVGALQATAAIKLLTGNESTVRPEMMTFDLWSQRFTSILLDEARNPECPACHEHRFDYLDARSADSTSLCGRDAVQVRPPDRRSIDLQTLSRRLSDSGTARIEPNSYFLRCELLDGSGLSLTVFPDGRAIIHGTTDGRRARSVYAKYVGT